MVDGAVHVHACHGWHTWMSMVSVVDLTQGKQTSLVPAQLSRELTRQVKMAGAERSGKPNYSCPSS